MKNISIKGTRTEYNVKIEVDPIEAIDGLIKDTLDLYDYGEKGVEYYIQDEDKIIRFLYDIEEDDFCEIEDLIMITENRDKVELFKKLIKAKEIIQKLRSE